MSPRGGRSRRDARSAAALGVEFDDQVFVLSPRGGVGRYFTELLREFDANPQLGVHVSTRFRYVVNEHVKQVAGRHFRTPALPSRALHPRVLHALNSAVDTATTSHSGRASEVLHYTHYAPRLLQPARRDRAQVCTVYDMTPEKFPHLFPEGNPHLAKDAYVRACDVILCISQTTKNDVLEHYGKLDKPVAVTPLGVSPIFTDPRPAPPIPEPYVLFVGQREAYKNFDVLLAAFAVVTHARPGLQLLCVGGPPFRPDEVARMDELGLAGRVQRVALSDARLAGAYAAAQAFVFPSLYEGFGLPTVEAFAAGCPVLLADTPCSVEVGAQAAAYFRPTDPDDLAQQLERVIGDSAVRAPMISAGRARARDFTWHNTARTTASAYRQAAGLAGGR